MNFVLKTERLTARPFTKNDTPFIIELLNTEGWIKYIGNRNIKTAEQARQYLIDGPIKSYADNGFGLYLIALKDSNTPVGMCGLIKRNYLPHPDIGYAFLPSFMGKGYAFEIAQAMLQFAFTQLKFGKVLAITLPENNTSVRLLLKLGMQFEKKITDATSNETLDMYGLAY
jgi:[ribosomal protein S5]-alanine N-acetyltransferase